MSLILEGIADCVALIDRDGRFIYLNRRAALEISPWTDVLGHRASDVLPTFAGSEFYEFYCRCVEDGQSRETEGYFKELANWYAVRVVPMPEGGAIFFRAITRQKTGEKQLEESERRFRTIFETLTQGIVVLDASGRIVDANPAAESILGIYLSDIKGTSPGDPIWKVRGQDEIPLPGNEHPAMIALRTGERVRDFNLEVRRPSDGEYRWLHVDATPICEQGTSYPSLVYAIFNDITEQRRSEYELQRSKLFLSIAQRVASTGSAAIDFKTGKWDWSDETYKIYGVDRNSFIPSAESLATLVHPDDRDELLSKPTLARQGITPPPIEYRITRPDGEERLLRREATLIREGGQVVGIVGTVQDVTDLRAAQREKDLLQEELQHAQRLDALGTLASGIAHDLNNTLVPVLALSEAIAKSLSVDDPRRPLIDLIAKAGERGRELVGQVLAFTRRENLDNRIVELSEFLPVTMRLIRAGLPSSIEIIERIEPVPPILGDTGQLHQVILNLFANAAQAIESETGQIEISVTEVTDIDIDMPVKTADSYILISVSDSGSGMDEDILARVFEPFFTTKRVGTGTGLGLSVVHGIVAAHGGEIRVSSRPGQGSRFDVYLPVLSPEEDWHISGRKDEKTNSSSR